ncbi:L-rhamnose-binding lectin CSL3-like [Antennarius striatus]|uniref:L-rhamnose-binding lectin CSL3-like n=1 Tax=Antennarius striatus TaxID=241820 RepID=UPI0035B07C42
MICLITTLWMVCVLFQPGYSANTHYRVECEAEERRSQRICKEVEVCEDSVARLDCGPNGAIYIYDAQYGRTDQSTCRIKDPVRCMDDVTHRLQERCALLQTCDVPVKSATFGSFCKGPGNYLRAAYFCHKTAIGCQGETINLSCDPGTEIWSGKIFYGRNDTTTCVAGRRPEEISNTNCKQSVYGHPHIAACEHKTSCQIEVNPENLGEPCPGTFKYLYFHYKCHPRRT